MLVKNYDNVTSDENLSKLQNELFEIKGIIDENVKLLLNRENDLKDIQSEAGFLTENARSLRKVAEKTKWQMQVRKYGMYAVIMLCLMFIALYYFVL